MIGTGKAGYRWLCATKAYRSAVSFLQLCCIKEVMYKAWPCFFWPTNIMRVNKRSKMNCK